MQLDKKQAGLSLGLLFGAMHLAWLILVVLGWARGWADAMLRYHFISKAYELGSFAWGQAIVGLIGALVCGYITGWVFAYIWNWAGEKV